MVINRPSSFAGRSFRARLATYYLAYRTNIASRRRRPLAAAAELRNNSPSLQEGFMENRLTSALIAIRRIVRAAEFAARDLSRAAGLTPSQLLLLQLVARRGKLGAGAIADATRLSHATVTALLDKLEQRGLLVRRRDAADRRRVEVALTVEGEAILAATPDALQDIFAKRFDRLADWEQAGLVAALERVAVLLDADTIDASPVLDVGSLRRSATGPDPAA
jgi:DNA-binding MarR family transcriptional regulator